ncbi:COG4315 family predicted lipoprotein [Nonomuraea glycinis]|uniref:COG4315 family predicted lipoprotein n=1 Tax=Nonomuraea glycinis TaxID=2047744 RepID=UPI0033B0D1A8
MTFNRNKSLVRARANRVVLSVACAVGVLGASACGKSIVITDAEPAAPAPASSAPASSAPASSAPATSAPPASPAGNTGLQLVGGSAAENGLSGNGGTPVGVQPQPQPAKWVQLSAVSAPAVGTYLVDVNQSALYRFDSDSVDVTRCIGECAVNWPPVTIKEQGKVYVTHGIEPSAIGAIERPDGIVQLTAGGWPIYRFSGDAKPGDLNGQGKDGVWFAVGPTGDKAKPS